MRTVFQAAFKGFDGAAEILALQPEVAHAEARLLFLRRPFQHLAVPPLRVFQLAGVFQEQRHVPHGGKSVRVRRHGAFVSGACAGDISQLLPHDAQVGVGLARFRARLQGLVVCFGGLFPQAGLLMGEGQVEPTLEVVRRHRNQQRAEFRGKRMVAGGARPCRQSFQGHGGFRLHLQQALGKLAHHVEVFLRHADQHQVGERFLRFRVARQDLLVQFGGHIAVAQRLQCRGLSEQAVFVVRRQFQAMLKGKQRGLGVFQPKPADAQSQVRVQIARLQLAGRLEGFRRFLPIAHALQANGQIEPAHGVSGLEADQGPIALGGFRVIVHFEQDMAHGAVDFRRGLIGRNGAAQLFQRFIALAGEVKRHGPRQVTARRERRGGPAVRYRPACRSRSLTWSFDRSGVFSTGLRLCTLAVVLIALVLMLCPPPN